MIWRTRMNCYHSQGLTQDNTPTYGHGKRGFNFLTSNLSKRGMPMFMLNPSVREYSSRSTNRSTNGMAILMLALVALVALSGTMLATPAYADENAKRVVLIPPFENFSGEHAYIYYEVQTSSNPDDPIKRIRVDRYSQEPRLGLENMLTRKQGPKFAVIERQRVDQMLMEGEFARSSGLVDESSAVKLGNALGANTVVMGTIRSITSETKEFKGYGVHTKNILVTCKMHVRVVDIATMNIIVSGEFVGTTQFPSSGFGGTKNEDVAQKVIDATMEKIKSDEEFIDLIVGKVAEEEVSLVKVTFDPSPKKADILIDGEYYGSAPATLELPEGKPVKVTIRKSGFETWEVTLKPRDGMNIAPELESK